MKAGALPVWVDPDPDAMVIDADRIEAAITEHTKAIVPVRMYGNPAHLDKVPAIAKKHNLKVVEDACQAWNAQ